MFEPENAEELCARLMELRSDAELRARLAANGPVAARRYDRGALARKMLRDLERVAADRRGTAGKTEAG